MFDHVGSTEKKKPTLTHPNIWQPALLHCIFIVIYFYLDFKRDFSFSYFLINFLVITFFLLEMFIVMSFT